MDTAQNLHKPARMSMRRFIESRVHCDDEFCRIKVLDCAVVARRTAYAAVEWVMKDNDRRQVLAMVLRLERAPASGGETILIQETIESMLPNDADCPRRILRLLTLTDDPHALEWRQRCHARGRTRETETRRAH
jgi:hypothetical protein